MSSSPPRTGGGEATAARRHGQGPLGPALRRAWISYQLRLDAAMASAGFGDRRFPDGRVLRLCRSSGTTISQIGRELGITRQGAAKLVSGLVDRGFVSVGPSPTSGREKVVTPTEQALEYLAAQRRATRRIEAELRRQIGPSSFDDLCVLLEAIGGTEQPRLRDYLRAKGAQRV